MEKRRFRIVECPRCHLLLIADADHRSRSCPACGKRFQIENLPTLAAARNSREARERLVKIKSDRSLLKTKDDIADSH